ncbi:hypothetical protein GmarT_02940 [Gimesia maris]|uniref:Uncharacterized protein n=1 Tax=Gimesia maris TaxID=122 RepID=A0ABX5YFN2_9PLAN|nr:hypothetical protein GmarT_02940 [Gimesia maris]
MVRTGLSQKFHKLDNPSIICREISVSPGILEQVTIYDINTFLCTVMFVRSGTSGF